MFNEIGFCTDNLLHLALLPGKIPYASKTSENSSKPLQAPTTSQKTRAIRDAPTPAGVRIRRSLRRAWRNVKGIRDDPYAHVKKIKGTKRHPLYTHSVGEYRAIMDITEDRLLIMVMETGHRSKIYRKY